MWNVIYTKNVSGRNKWQNETLQGTNQRLERIDYGNLPNRRKKNNKEIDNIK